MNGISHEMLVEAPPSPPPSPPMNQPPSQYNEDCGLYLDVYTQVTLPANYDPNKEPSLHYYHCGGQNNLKIRPKHLTQCKAKSLYQFRFKCAIAAYPNVIKAACPKLRSILLYAVQVPKHVTPGTCFPMTLQQGGAEVSIYCPKKVGPGEYMYCSYTPGAVLAHGSKIPSKDQPDIQKMLVKHATNGFTNKEKKEGSLFPPVFLVNNDRQEGIVHLNQFDCQLTMVRILIPKDAIPGEHFTTKLGEQYFKITCPISAQPGNYIFKWFYFGTVYKLQQCFPATTTKTAATSDENDQQKDKIVYLANVPPKISSGSDFYCLICETTNEKKGGTVTKIIRLTCPLNKKEGNVIRFRIGSSSEVVANNSNGNKKEQDHVPVREHNDDRPKNTDTTGPTDKKWYRLVTNQLGSCIASIFYPLRRRRRQRRHRYRNNHQEQLEKRDDEKSCQTLPTQQQSHHW